ncbi:MAG: hypothetical protein IJZ68_05830 [Bacteroidaceae bacterium]|nr:hypothetical protein [Bacteroidaceae bacterium]
MRRIIVILLCVLCLSGCSKSEPEPYITTAVIDHIEWKIVADVQELKTFDESGWEVPEGAVVYKEQQEVKTHEVIGYETKYRTEEYQEKIGYYLPTWRPRYETRTRKVAYKEPILKPVYATRYYYHVDRWVHTKEVQLGQGRDHNVEYTEYTPAENERVHEVEQKYIVWFKIGDHWQGLYVEKEQWEMLQTGQEVQVERTENRILRIVWTKEE